MFNFKHMLKSQRNQWVLLRAVILVCFSLSLHYLCFSVFQSSSQSREPQLPHSEDQCHQIPMSRGGLPGWHICLEKLIMKVYLEKLFSCHRDINWKWFLIFHLGIWQQTLMVYNIHDRKAKDNLNLQRHSSAFLASAEEFFKHNNMIS